MQGLIILTLVFVAVVILVSLMFKEIGQRIFTALAFGLISVIFFFISFVVGSWEGIGLGAVSVSLLLSSFIALIAIVLLDKLKINDQQS